MEMDSKELEVRVRKTGFVCFLCQLLDLGRSFNLSRICCISKMKIIVPTSFSF